MKKLLASIVVALLAVAAAAAGYAALQKQGPQRTAVENAPPEGGTPTPTPAPESPAPLKLPLSNPKIFISKSRRELTLYEGGRAARVYRVGLGLNPVDDKTRAGDYCTPEGEFYIFTKNPQSAFYLSLGISYPNAEDAERGLRDRLITKAQHRRIVDAIRRRETPPQNTRLGGLIYIHGHGAGSDWTWGCVALEDKDMKELFDATPVGTPVVIEH